MAHFAEVDDNNVVLRVLVINDYDILDENGNESEEVGRVFCNATWGGRWVQTSYNHRIRKRYAGIGFIYDEENDAFLPPKYFPSWVVDTELLDWVPPIPMPAEDPGEGLMYVWDEEQLQWDTSPL